MQRALLTVLMGAVGAAAVSAQTLRVNSTPEGARVEVDGVPVGRTPTTAPVEAGTRTVRLTRAGYADWEQTVEVGAEATVEVRARLERRTGTVQVRGLPDGSRVTLDGQPISGPTAAPSGGVALQVEVPGRRPFEVGLPVAAGAETVAVYRARQFQSNTALVAVAIPGGAQILDGRQTVGVAVAGVVAAGAITAAVQQIAYSDNRDDYETGLIIYRDLRTEAEVVEQRAALDALVDRSGQIRRVQQGALVLAGVAYLAGVADAFLHHVWKPGFEVSTPRLPTVSLSGAGARLTMPL